MPKVLFIGLDGATYDLIDPLLAAGVMPHFAEVLSGSVRARLFSTRNPLTPPAWTSIVTGRSPNAHNIHDFLRPVAAGDHVYLKVNDSRDNRCETVWSMVSRQGLRATTLNFYGHSPAPRINGYSLSGFVPWKHLRHATYPPEIFDWIKSLSDFDFKDLGMDIGEEKKCVQGLMEGEFAEWITLQNTRDSAWTRLTCELMARDRTELTAVVLDGPDKMQHLFWRYLAPEFAHTLTKSDDAHTRQQCLDYFRGLDRNIATLMDAAGPDTNVIFASDHGFGATTEVVYLNSWLAQRGYLAWSDRAEGAASGKLSADRMRDHLAMIDWPNTRAYCPTPSSNAIFVKRAQDGKNGVDTANYAQFCLQLQRQLLDYRDPQTGTAVFTEAYLNRLEGEPYADACPDITVQLRDRGFVSILKSDRIAVQRPHAEGTHRPDGLFAGYGPNFHEGVDLEAFSLLSITPLMLHLLGLPVPNDLEGDVPQRALRGEQTVSSGAASQAPVSDGSAGEPSEADKQALMDQMRLLGYLD